MQTRWFPVRNTLVAAVVVALLAVLVWAVLPGRGPTRESGVATGDEACPDCTIELTPLVTLLVNEMTHPLVGEPTAVVSGPGGRRLVFHAGGAPSLFDSNGRFVQEIGRLGQGPGEYQYPVNAVFLPGDSILILDTGQLRATVLDSGLNPIRTISLPVMASAAAVLAWPERVAVAGTSYAADFAGLPLHLLDLSDESARHLQSVRDDPAEPRTSMEGALPLPRQLFAGDSDSFWAAHVVEYRLNRISADGEVVQSVHRTPEWFAEAAPTVHRGNPSLAPPSLLRSLAVRGDTLWLAFDVARPDWGRAWGGIVIPPSGELLRGNAPEVTGLVMGRIQAIDLRSGALVASRDVDGMVVGLDREAQVVVYDLDGNLLPRLRVMEFSIRTAGL